MSFQEDVMNTIHNVLNGEYKEAIENLNDRVRAGQLEKTVDKNLESSEPEHMEH